MNSPPASTADVAVHYGGADLLAAIHAGIDKLGKTTSTITIDDLAPVDEFHVGGRQATAQLCRRMGITSAARVLDVGCGIGGTARFIADRFGCAVTGIDLTAHYIDVARTLTDWVGLSDHIRYETGDATAMPFADSTFDRVVQLHVGMNIAHKHALFTEVNRVLEPGGIFGLYDIMKTSDGEISYPVPWAGHASISFVEDPDAHRRTLDAAGFEIYDERDRRNDAIEFFAAMKDRANTDGPPPLGLHLIVGDGAPIKIANLVEAITSGVLAPVEIISRKSA